MGADPLTSASRLSTPTGAVLPGRTVNLPEGTAEVPLMCTMRRRPSPALFSRPDQPPQSGLLDPLFQQLPHLLGIFHGQGGINNRLR